MGDLEELEDERGLKDEMKFWVWEVTIEEYSSPKRVKKREKEKRVLKERRRQLTSKLQLHCN